MGKDPAAAGDGGEPAARQESGAARRPGGDLGRRRGGLEWRESGVNGE